jgi:hypothetical protein
MRGPCLGMPGTSLDERCIEARWKRPEFMAAREIIYNYAWTFGNRILLNV